MDVKAGATVGFVAALGGLSGAITGAFFAGILDAKGDASEKMTTFGAGAGALVGAFIGGVIVAPAAPATVAGVPPSQLP
jgi:hypothetical protein